MTPESLHSLDSQQNQNPDINNINQDDFMLELKEAKQDGVITPKELDNLVDLNNDGLLSIDERDIKEHASKLDNLGLQLEFLLGLVELGSGADSGMYRVAENTVNIANQNISELKSQNQNNLNEIPDDPNNSAFDALTIPLEDNEIPDDPNNSAFDALTIPLEDNSLDNEIEKNVDNGISQSAQKSSEEVLNAQKINGAEKTNGNTDIQSIDYQELLKTSQTNPQYIEISNHIIKTSGYQIISSEQWLNDPANADLIEKYGYDMTLHGDTKFSLDFTLKEGMNLSPEVKKQLNAMPLGEQLISGRVTPQLKNIQNKEELFELLDLIPDDSKILLTLSNHIDRKFWNTPELYDKFPHLLLQINSKDLFENEIIFNKLMNFGFPLRSFVQVIDNLSSTYLFGGNNDDGENYASNTSVIPKNISKAIFGQYSGANASKLILDLNKYHIGLIERSIKQLDGADKGVYKDQLDALKQFKDSKEINKKLDSIKLYTREEINTLHNQIINFKLDNRNNLKYSDLISVNNERPSVDISKTRIKGDKFMLKDYIDTLNIICKKYKLSGNDLDEYSEVKIFELIKKYKKDEANAYILANPDSFPKGYNILNFINTEILGIGKKQVSLNPRSIQSSLLLERYAGANILASFHSQNTTEKQVSDNLQTSHTNGDNSPLLTEGLAGASNSARSHTQEAEKSTSMLQTIESYMSSKKLFHTFQLLLEINGGEKNTELFLNLYNENNKIDFDKLNSDEITDNILRTDNLWNKNNRLRNASKDIHDSFSNIIIDKDDSRTNLDEGIIKNNNETNTSLNDLKENIRENLTASNIFNENEINSIIEGVEVLQSGILNTGKLANTINETLIGNELDDKKEAKVRTAVDILVKIAADLRDSALQSKKEKTFKNQDLSDGFKKYVKGNILNIDLLLANTETGKSKGELSLENYTLEDLNALEGEIKTWKEKDGLTNEDRILLNNVLETIEVLKDEKINGLTPETQEILVQQITNGTYTNFSDFRENFIIKNNNKVNNESDNSKQDITNNEKNESGDLTSTLFETTSNGEFMFIYEGEGGIKKQVEISSQEAQLLKTPEAQKNYINLYGEIQKLGLPSLWDYRKEIMTAMGDITVNPFDGGGLEPSELLKFKKYILEISTGTKLKNNANANDIDQKLRNWAAGGNELIATQKENILGDDRFLQIMKTSDIIDAETGRMNISKLKELHQSL